jgi:hypothetical protein
MKTNSWCNSFTFLLVFEAFVSDVGDYPRRATTTHPFSSRHGVLPSPFLPHVVCHPLGALPECEVDCPCRSDLPQISSRKTLCVTPSDLVNHVSMCSKFQMKNVE